MTLKPTVSKVLVMIACVVGGVAAGVLAGRLGPAIPLGIAGAGVTSPWSAAEAESALAAYPWREGEQMLVVFYGASFCRFCRDSRMPRILDDIRVGLSEYALKKGLVVVTIGVALDASVDAGLEFLEELGRFDQVAVGGLWANEFALSNLDRHLPAVFSVPQVIVYRRTLDVVSGVRQVRDVALLARKEGILELEEWARRGVPMPELAEIAPTDAASNR